jgi:type I restriction enzyme S subunit
LAYSATGPDGFLEKFDYDREGIVLSAIGANCGSTFFASGKWSCIKNTIRILPKSGAVDLKYFFYMTKATDFWPIRGSAQPFISQTDIRELYVQIPEISVQNVIGKVLFELEQKISTNNALSKTLEDIAQAIFKSWFIDFDPIKAKMVGDKPVGMDAATATLFPDVLEDSELGLIPNGWQVGSLFDFSLEIESGSRPKGGVKGISSGVPSIGAESINGLGVFDFSKTKFVPREFYEKMNKGKPRDFDVLLYKDGGKPGEFRPRVGMYGLGFPFSEFAVNEHVFILRAKELGNPYLYFWIRLERTLDILRSRGIKAAIPGINQQDVGTIPILRPSKEVLNAFNELAMPSISLILTLASESMQLVKLRDTLLPRLISGELQIPEEMLAS